MAKTVYGTLSSRVVGKLKVEKDTVFWDRELTGFGVRVYPTGPRSTSPRRGVPRAPSA